MKPAKTSVGPFELYLANPKAKLLDQVQEVIRFKHYSIRTEQACVQWIKSYTFFHQKKHPRDMEAEEIQTFLTHLAASTQNQALNALVFLYRQVLRLPAGDFSEFERACRPVRLPVVLSAEEIRRLLAAVKPGTLSLMARMLHGTGTGFSGALQTPGAWRGAEAAR